MKKTTTRPSGLLPVLLLLALPAATEAQFDYTTNNGAISITGCRYPFPGGWMTIPATITGLPVTSIGNFAFMYRLDLTGVTIPGSVTSIGGYAFYDCYWLASATIGDGVTNIGQLAFFYSGLTSVFFQGNAPRNVGADAFEGDKATAYYLPGTTGWGPTFCGLPTMLWNPQNFVARWIYPEASAKKGSHGDRPWLLSGKSQCLPNCLTAGSSIATYLIGFRSASKNLRRFPFVHNKL